MMTIKTTTPLLIGLLILSVTFVAVWAQQDPVAPATTPKSQLPKVNDPVALSNMREALMACGNTLTALDAEFSKLKLAPSTWQPAAAAMLEQWDTYMGRATRSMLKNLPKNIGSDLVKNQLNPWVAQYRGFIRTVIIAPSNAAVSWKYTVDQRTSTWKGLPRNTKSIIGSLKEEADDIGYEYEELKAYADSAGDVGFADMSEHSRMKTRARILVTRTQNLGSMLSDKQKNLTRIFKDEHPDTYGKVLETTILKPWSLEGEYPDYPAVLSGWKDTVSEWGRVCIDRYDEYAKQYEIAKTSCEPIIKGTIFKNYPPLRDLYFSNLEMNVRELQKQIDGM